MHTRTHAHTRAHTHTHTQTPSVNTANSSVWLLHVGMLVSNMDQHASPIYDAVSENDRFLCSGRSEYLPDADVEPRKGPLAGNGGCLTGGLPRVRRGEGGDIA